MPLAVAWLAPLLVLAHGATLGSSAAFAAFESSSAASTSGGPVLLLGPTANLQLSPGDKESGVDSHSIVRELLLLVDGTGPQTWPSTFRHVNSSGGALHVRSQVLASFMSDKQQSNFARATTALGLRVSIEGGGALCGSGSGAAQAQASLKHLQPFTSAGGRFAFWALESVFSRTKAACESQPHAQTTAELASFAAALAKGLPAPAPAFFLYDALPHFSVGAAWPANAPSYGLELGAVLPALQAAMDQRGVRLEGYWMDCPYEYSVDYPNASAPLPAHDGFKKIAAVVSLVKGLGLSVGKTFNSQLGGTTSDEMFYNRTLADWRATAAYVPSAASGGHGLDFILVESWYYYPLLAAPESQAYTTTHTAKAVFDLVPARHQAYTPTN